MFELFADIFTYQQNALVKTDPRIKLPVAMWIIVLIVSSRSVRYPLSVLLFCALLLAVLHVPLRVVINRLLVPLGVVAVILLLKLFLTAGTPLFTVSVADITLSASREGLLTGLTMGARVMGACSMIILLGVTTPAHEVFRALFWMKAPREWVEVAMLMYRYIFVLIETTVNMATAQKLRLGFSEPRRCLRSMGILSGAVILRSADQAVKTSEAMILRGYNGTLPIERMRPLGRTAGMALLGICGFWTILYGVLEWLLI